MGKKLGVSNLDKQIISDLERLNFISQKIIFSNPRKKRFDLLVKEECSDSLYFLKWSHPNAPKIHTNKLRKEIEFYKNHKASRYLLKLLYSEDNFMLLEYFDAITIRQWLIDYKAGIGDTGEFLSADYKLLIKKLCDCLHGLYFNSDQNKKFGRMDIEGVSEKIKGNWDRLLSCGPMYTSRTLIEDYMGRLLRFLFNKGILIYVKCILNKYNDTKVNIENIHGDLHANNVLVSRDNLNFKIIDWEDTEDGFWLTDFAYIYVVLYAMMRDLPKHQKFLHDSFDELITINYPECKKTFLRFCNLLKIAISTNRRFTHNLSFWTLVVEYICFPFRILQLLYRQKV